MTYTCRLVFFFPKVAFFPDRRNHCVPTISEFIYSVLHLYYNRLYYGRRKLEAPLESHDHPQAVAGSFLGQARSSLQLSLTGVTLGENCQQLANGTNVEMNVFVKCSMDLTVASDNEHGVADTRGSQPTTKSCVIRKV